jgi:hypothetical protein
MGPEMPVMAGDSDDGEAEAVVGRRKASDVTGPLSGYTVTRV